ncbi:hypothetical protein [Neorhizobium sp. NCHU2750]|uniref:hypothetical protein n=1 Tax=Neorhizobium sp. NCHU2750 TaxID=1825976 RepID=UPI000E762358|nr:hypothetical protein NCHU2750_23700 [Neorhizobium sp. NCHU2750]
MMTDDELFSACFEEGRRAGRIGLPITTNPYLDQETIEIAAWVEGFASVDTAALIPSERAHIFHEGQTAATNGQLASTCPYLEEENPRRMEIWLMGYAPHVEEH